MSSNKTLNLKSPHMESRTIFEIEGFEGRPLVAWRGRADHRNLTYRNTSVLHFKGIYIHSINIAHCTNETNLENAENATDRMPADRPIWATLRRRAGG